MKSPAVLLYTSDFLVGTMFMNNEEVGKYIRLLCMQHQKGHLQEKDFYGICKKDDVKVIEKFVKDKEGKYFNKRMDIEISKRNEFSKSRSKNRKGKPNKIREKQEYDMINISKSYEEHMDNENDNINDNIYYTNKELNNIFIEYLLLRKKLKAVNSKTAIKLLMNKLDKFDDATKIKMIENSIQSSWKSVYEIKDFNKDAETPKWFDKEVKANKMSDEEEKELKKSLEIY